MTRLFIGIEGGATKTEGVLIDDNGEILVTLQTGPSNPWVINCCLFKYFIGFV